MLMIEKICLMVVIIVIGFTLAGCDPQELQVPLKEYHVVLAPESMYNCPVVKVWPKVNNVTDLQVARKLVELAEANRICKTSMDAIHNFYNTAAANIEMKTQLKKKK